ncbi:hypothetical protein NM688_g5534 [Phlebia brevispora]|uniref:Uncharacterized protein n=1 Tax=Phlebia brevispora TaxID=194682 RepID=A0ACC1SU24_9APHY|nr:hypothetical protein NM688_g5534 [Phlebia brevispora]
MEGRARDYANNARMIMDELTGWDWNLVVIPYGPQWRARRRLFHQFFNQNAAKQYVDVQTREVRAFLRRTAESYTDTGEFDIKTIRKTLSAIVLEITYGMKIADLNDPYLLLSQKAIEAVNIGRVPGAFWVEYFPWLRYIPSWVPGSSARKFGEQYYPAVRALRDDRFDVVMNDVSRGTALPSIARKLIEKLPSKVSDEDKYREFGTYAKDMTGIVYIAGVDTQFAALSAFLLGILLVPRVQRQAQRELDSVVGPTRLPSVEDMSSLPYIQAIAMEALRWIPALPLGVPRRATCDDEYGGYTIPAGSIIIANVWALLHDSEMYPDPETFNPDRFIRDGQLNPDVRPPTAAFGFGRRKCVGRHLATNTLHLMIASILHVFNIKPVSEDFSAAAGTGFLSFAQCPPCRFVPRTASAMALINTAST